MLTLKDIMETLGGIHAGISMGHGIYIGKGGAWSASQSVVAYLPFKSENECALDLKNTKNALSALTEHTYEWNEAELLVKAGRVRVKLPYVPIDHGQLSLYKKLASLRKKSEWKPIPEKLAEAISICSRSISDDAMHGTLTCFNFSGSSVTTSNNVTVTQYDIGEDFATAMVNKPALLAAMSITPTQYATTSSSMLFKNEEGIVVQIPVVNGTYQDFEPILATKADRTIKVDNEQLIYIANLTEKLFDGGNIMDNSILVQCKNRKLLISNSSQSGQVKAMMNINFDGEFKFITDSTTLRLLVDTSATLGLTKDDKLVIVEGENIKLIAAVGGA